MIRIEMTNEVITNEKRDGSGTYQRQVAYAHTCDENGKPERYPRKVLVFVGRNGVYAAGDYRLAPQSVQVSPRGDLEMRFPTFERIEQSKVTPVDKRA